MKKLLLFLLAPITFFACNKKKDETCTLSSTAMQGSYKTSAVRYKASASSPEQDIFNSWFANACERDDIVTLNANGTYVSTDAGTQCSPVGTYNGTWSLSGNNFTWDGDAYIVEDFQCNSTTVTTTNVVTAGDKLIIVMARQ